MLHQGHAAVVVLGGGTAVRRTSAGASWRGAGFLAGGLLRRGLLGRRLLRPAAFFAGGLLGRSLLGGGLLRAGAFLAGAFFGVRRALGVDGDSVIVAGVAGSLTDWTAAAAPA